MLIITIFSISIFKSFFHPAVFYSLLWSIYTIIPIFIFGITSFSVVYFGWMTLSVLAVVLGALIVEVPLAKLRVSKTKYDKSEKDIYHLDMRFNGALLKMYICIGLLSFILYLSRNGYSLTDLFNLSGLLELNASSAYNRYYGTGGGAFYDKFLLPFIYLAPAVGGMMVVFDKSLKSKRLSAMSLFPLLLNLVVTNTKAGLIIGIITWFSSWVVTSIAFNGKPQVNFKLIYKSFVTFIFIIMIFIFSMLARIGSFTGEVLLIVLNKFQIYLFGYSVSFSTWLDSLYNSNMKYLLGERTFGGLFDLLGLGERLQGVYKDIIYFKKGSTNIFTMHRGLIEDYSLFGAILFFLIIGFTSSFIYRKLTFSKPIYIVMLCSYYMFVIYGIIISVLTYNSIIASLFLYVIHLYLAIKKGEKYVTKANEKTAI